MSGTVLCTLLGTEQYFGQTIFKVQMADGSIVHMGNLDYKRLCGAYGRDGRGGKKRKTCKYKKTYRTNKRNAIKKSKRRR